MLPFAGMEGGERGGKGEGFVSSCWWETNEPKRRGRAGKEERTAHIGCPGAEDKREGEEEEEVEPRQQEGRDEASVAMRAQTAKRENMFEPNMPVRLHAGSGRNCLLVPSSVSTIHRQLVFPQTLALSADDGDRSRGEWISGSHVLLRSCVLHSKKGVR